MGIASDIVDEIIAALGTIATPTYNTANVVAQEGIVATSKLNAEDARAHIGVRWTSRSARFRGNSADAEATIRGHAVMRNATYTAFDNFLEDIEEVIAERFNPEITVDQAVDGVNYGGLKVTVASIDILDVEEAIADRTREAEILMTATYQYTPHLRGD